MADIQALIARVEQASGPDRELDKAISLATLPPIMPGSMPLWPEGMPPRFTASLDAAMSLVPDDARWCLKTEHDSTGYAAFIFPDGGEGVASAAATPALALLSAALRARKAP